MFRSACFDDDPLVDVEAPPRPGGWPSPKRHTGTFVLGFMIPDDQIDVLREWSGCSYPLGEFDDRVCMTARIVMGSAEAAPVLATAIAESLSGMTAVTETENVSLERCLLGS